MVVVFVVVVVVVAWVCRVAVVFRYSGYSLIERMCTEKGKELMDIMLAVLGKPKWVEYSYLNPSFGYGVYVTGPSTAFHFAINDPDAT